MNKLEEDLKTLIALISDNFTQEVIEKNEDTLMKIKSIYKSDERGFLEKIESANYKINIMIEQVLDIPEQKNMYILEHIVSGLYKHFFRQLMEKVEGPACCADKANFIKNMTLKSLRENRNLSLYEDYTKYDQILEDKEKQAYWSPITIKDTDAAIELFWEWYLLK